MRKKFITFSPFCENGSICVLTSFWYFVMHSPARLSGSIQEAANKHKRKHMVLCSEKWCQSHHCRDLRKCISDANWFHKTRGKNSHISKKIKWKKYINCEETKHHWQDWSSVFFFFLTNIPYFFPPQILTTKKALKGTNFKIGYPIRRKFSRFQSSYLDFC